MIDKEKMDKTSHAYDLEEGEILDEEEEEREEIFISEDFQNPYYFEDALKNSLYASSGKNVKLREESRYPEEFYLPRRTLVSKRNLKYSKTEKPSKKLRKSYKNHDYNPKIEETSSVKLKRRKSRSRSCSCSLSSSSSSCSCSSCTSCSVSPIKEKRVQPSSHSIDESHFFKLDQETKKKIGIQRKKESRDSVVKRRKNYYAIVKPVREKSPIYVKKSVSEEVMSKLKKSSSKNSPLDKPYKERVPCLSRKSKKTKSENQKILKKKKEDLSNASDSLSSESVALVNEITFDKDSVIPKIIPGSLGEMLLKKQLKTGLKKESTTSSEKSKSQSSQESEELNTVSPTKSFEVVDLCDENDENSEEDELMLRIKALESAMKTRGLMNASKSNCQDDKFESTNLDEKNIGIIEEKDKVESNDSKKPVIEYEGSALNSVSKGSKKSDNGLEKESKELDGIGIQSKTPEIVRENISKEKNIKNKTPVTNLGTEGCDPILKDKCENISIDMDISNDSFSDISAQAEVKECGTSKKHSAILNQDKGFPFPIEWAYMIPPPNPDQPDSNNLNNIRNWCFNQNMYVQSMQQSVNNETTEDSCKSVPTSSHESENNYSNGGNYYIQSHTTTTTATETCNIAYGDCLGDYSSSNVISIDTSMQSSELRDCHAEQYKSFMSTVIQNNIPSLNCKKDQYRDLINIDLKSGKYQSSNYATLKPDKKSTAAKRRIRKRRRSNRKSDTVSDKNEEIIAKPDMSAIDDEDEDMLRALLLNDLTLKNQKLNQIMKEQKFEINNNNNNNIENDEKTRDNSLNRSKKYNFVKDQRVVKVGESLEVSIPNSKFKKSNLQTRRSTWKSGKKLVSKSYSPSMLKDPMPADQKFNNDDPLRGFSLAKFPPVKPVVININNDSDSEEEKEEERIIEPLTSCDKIISGIDSFIKNLRNKQSILQKESFKLPTVKTPKGVSHLSKEKQQEYRRLKQLMVSKREALQLKSKKSLKCLAKPLSSTNDDDSSAVVNKSNRFTEEAKTAIYLSAPSIESYQKIVDVDDTRVGKCEMKIISPDVLNSQDTVEIDSGNHEDKKPKVNLAKNPVINLQILSAQQSEDLVFKENLKVNFLIEEPDSMLEYCVPNNLIDEKFMHIENIKRKEVDDVITGSDIIPQMETDDTLSHVPTLKMNNTHDNPQDLLSQEISSLGNSLNGSNDLSEGSSSSDSESSASSSSSDESDTDSENKMEIDLRNRLLQKRQQQLLQKNKESISPDDDKSCIENSEYSIYKETSESVFYNFPIEIQEEATCAKNSNQIKETNLVNSAFLNGNELESEREVSLVADAVNDKITNEKEQANSVSSATLNEKEEAGKEKKVLLVHDAVKDTIINGKEETNSVSSTMLNEKEEPDKEGKVLLVPDAVKDTTTNEKDVTNSGISATLNEREEVGKERIVFLFPDAEKNIINEKEGTNSESSTMLNKKEGLEKERRALLIPDPVKGDESNPILSAVTSLEQSDFLNSLADKGTKEMGSEISSEEKIHLESFQLDNDNNIDTKMNPTTIKDKEVTSPNDSDTKMNPTTIKDKEATSPNDSDTKMNPTTIKDKEATSPNDSDTKKNPTTIKDKEATSPNDSDTKINPTTIKDKEAASPNDSLLNKIAIAQNEKLKIKQDKAKDCLNQTFSKLQEEINKRILSIEALNSRISNLFLEAEKEDSFCQSLFSNIIKLLSQISEMRKNRKDRKSRITAIFSKIIGLLQKVNDDTNFMNKMEILLKKHYFENHFPLVSNFTSKKLNLEKEKRLNLQKINQLRENVKLLDSQENILHKTFSKPLEENSSRTSSRRTPISLTHSPQQMNQKKKPFKIDNRPIFQWQTNKVTENNNSSCSTSSRTKWKLNNDHKATTSVFPPRIATKALPPLVPTPKKTGTIIRKIRNPNELHQQHTADVPPIRQTLKNDVRNESKTSKDPENDKFVDDIILCPYDLLGRCNDDQCIYQHMSAATNQVRSSILCSRTSNNESIGSSPNLHKDKGKNLRENVDVKVSELGKQFLQFSNNEISSTKTASVNEIPGEASVPNDCRVVLLLPPNSSNWKKPSEENRTSSFEKIEGSNEEAVNLTTQREKKICKKRKGSSNSPLKKRKGNSNNNNNSNNESVISPKSIEENAPDKEGTASARKVTVIFEDPSEASFQTLKETSTPTVTCDTTRTSISQEPSSSNSHFRPTLSSSGLKRGRSGMRLRSSSIRQNIKTEGVHSKSSRFIRGRQKLSRRNLQKQRPPP